MWAQALATIDDFAKAHPQNPRLLQARVQCGLVQLAWGELLAQEVDTGSGRDERVAAARDHLRKAIEELRKGPTRRPNCNGGSKQRRKLAPGELSNTELRSLERNTNYQIARALRSQGESYPVESADRAQLVDAGGGVATPARARGRHRSANLAQPLGCRDVLSDSGASRGGRAAAGSTRRRISAGRRHVLEPAERASAWRWPSITSRQALAIVEKGTNDRWSVVGRS